jgi:hypothetical protein
MLISLFAEERTVTAYCAKARRRSLPNKKFKHHWLPQAVKEVNQDEVALNQIVHRKSQQDVDLVGGNYTISLILSIVGVILISISGWLGGEMVFKHGVAVAAGSEPSPKNLHEH